MHGVHGRRWSVCVGWEDRKMTARLMKRSGATLIKDGGKVVGKKGRRGGSLGRKLDPRMLRRGRSVGGRSVGFGRTARSLGNSRWVALFFRCD